jgi:hypothetical protein
MPNWVFRMTGHFIELEHFQTGDYVLLEVMMEIFQFFIGEEIVLYAVLLN